MVTVGAQTSPRRMHLVAGAWSALIGIVILAPLAAPGYVLSYDMVAVPDQAVMPSSFGLGSALPRAVPLDAVVAIADSLVPGAVLQRIALAAIVVGGSLGAALAMPGTRTGPRLVAASVYGWNAYVFERLVLGHWPLLLAYAALPWVLMAGRRLRAGRPGAGAGGVLLVGLSSLTATGGILASALLMVLTVLPGGHHRRRTRMAVVAGVLLVQAPWVVPGAIRPDAAVSDAAGVSAFATRADSPWGVLGSVATLGGVWNSAVVPATRSSVAAAVLSAVIVLLAVAGWRGLTRSLGRAEAVALGGLAATGIVLAVAATVPAGAAAVRWLVAEVPGGGLLRDGQKFLAWYALPLALAAAAGAGRIARAVGGRLATGVVVAAALMPMAALPDLGWGAAGRLTPVQYPQEWAQVRSALHESSAAGDLVVLPFQPYRSFPWAGERTVLDPAPRYLGIETVLPDDLPVGGEIVPGEDDRADRVAAALDGDRPLDRLASAGVGWIAVQHDTPGAVPAAVVDSAEAVVRTATMDLYRVPRRVDAWTDIPPIGPVVAAGIVYSVTLLIASGDLVRIACLRRTRWLRSPVS